MAAPEKVVELVERFKYNRDAYRNAHYKEAQLRKDFIDPMFREMGWDMDNAQGYAEAYREVVQEDTIKVGGATKAPDYCFRIGGARKFFLEAKKPAVNVKDEISPAFQLRRYAWSAKLPLSVLTDFEEFSVYECRTRPTMNEKAAKGRVMYLTFEQYADAWDDIAGVFGRDAILRGGFDKYVESAAAKKGTAEVDAEFLKEIESWRDRIARNFALRNPSLSQRELNFAVQRTIDRVIFLRICEDRGIEDYGRLMALRNGDHVYERLAELFRQADDRYNSGLFHFSPGKDRDEAPDALTLALSLDDNVLKDLIRRLYYPESPYEFSVLPADILGQVYEQFLGKVIRLTAGHQAKVEEKPEVRKAGGVYYTPTYIVDYIVKNTVGRLIGECRTGLGERVNEGKKGGGDGAEVIQGTGGVAAGDGPRGGGVPAGGAVAEGGAVRAEEPGAAGGRVDPGQHCRGLRADTSRGLCAPLVRGDGIGGGTGDAPGDRSAARVSDGGPDTSGERAAGACGEDAHAPDSIAATPPALIPTPQPETRAPQPAPRLLTPRDVSKLRVLDPACGSGSFLIGAYQYLLDWHVDWYTRNLVPLMQAGNATTSPEVKQLLPESTRKKKLERADFPVYQASPNDWRLTTTERKRILLNNLYGVDIDPQAVEVTKLSLLLKVLEGESGESLQRQLRLWDERALPDLGDNIKCGNSLIGPDFYEGKQLAMFDDDEQYRINAFDWHAEFPDIFTGQNPGFDAVIGNPPYVRQEALSTLKEYFGKRYEAFTSTADLYTYFMERAVTLLREQGRFSFIVSSGFLRTNFAAALRQTLKQHAAVLAITDFGGLAVFSSAKDTYVCIPLLANVPQPPRVEVTRVPSLDVRDLAGYVDEHHFTIPHERLSRDAWALTSDVEASVFQKVMRVGAPLGAYIGRRMYRGLLTGLNAAFELKSEGSNRPEENGPDHPLVKTVIGGQDIPRYRVRRSARRMIVIPSGWTRAAMADAKETGGVLTERGAWSWLCRQHPDITRHLEPFADACRRRQDQGEFWWELRPCDYYSYFDKPKIVFPDICKNPRFFLDRSGLYLLNTAYCLGVDDPYLLGILNSKLFWFAISNISIPFGVRAGHYRYRLIYQYMAKVPIRVVEATDTQGQTMHDRLVELVQQMLDLHRKLDEVRTADDKTRIQRQIASTDQQIDRLVYELYGLTEDEIKIVEESR